MTAFNKAWNLLKYGGPRGMDGLDDDGNYPQGKTEPAQPAQPLPPLPPSSQVKNRFYRQLTLPVEYLDPSTKEYEREFDRVHRDIE